MTSPDDLAEAAAGLGIGLSAQQLGQFAAYATLLQEWSQRMNLTAIRDPQVIAIRHFLDSLTCSLATGDLNGHRLIDVGTGAGFPGLPLKILYPEMRLALSDSVAKKTQFLSAVVDALALTDVAILPIRAEDLGQDPAHREAYDWAVARSVAHLPVLAEYLLPLVRVGGHALAQKGEHAEQEIDAAQGALAQLGGAVGAVHWVRLPNLEEAHALITLDKLAPTDPKYPRRAGIPTKRPL